MWALIRLVNAFERKKFVSQDLLHAVVEMPSPPDALSPNIGRVSSLRDLAVALSSCIYQSLCDSDSFSVSHESTEVGIDGFIKYVIAYRLVDSLTDYF